MSTSASTTPTRCVCAAALERARALYGHLDGERVWAEFAFSPGSRYLGVLRILTDRPGYVYLDRGDADRSRTRHIDDILDVVTDAEKEAARARRIAEL